MCIVGNRLDAVGYETYFPEAAALPTTDCTMQYHASVMVVQYHHVTLFVSCGIKSYSSFDAPVSRDARR